MKVLQEQDSEDFFLFSMYLKLKGVKMSLWMTSFTLHLIYTSEGKGLVSGAVDWSSFYEYEYMSTVLDLIPDNRYISTFMLLPPRIYNIRSDRSDVQIYKKWPNLIHIIL